VFDAPREAGTDRFDPQTRAALIWRSHRDRWRDCVALPADVVAALDAIELEQTAAENVG
jgi:hypothetical protein